MPAGRPRKATITHIRNGKPGHHPRSLENEPQPELAAPDPPPHLTVAALEEWNRIATEMADAGMLTRLDRGNMTGYCQCWADYLEAQKHLDEEPKIFRTETGYPVMTPWKAYRDTALMEMRKFGTELGLSAPARSRIHVRAKKRDESQGVRRFLA